MNQPRMPNHAVAGGAWIKVAQLSIPALLALARRGLDSGRKAVTVVVLLWSTLIVVLQLAVYEPSIVGLSALKVLFVVAPLLTGSWIAHRVLKAASCLASNR